MTADDARVPAHAYDLDQLGWLQFERLCSLVLDAEAGLAELAWSGHADVARGASPDVPVRFAGQIAAAGPLTLTVIWVPEGLGPLPRRADFARRLAHFADARALGPEDLILALTNLDAVDARDGAAAVVRASPLPRLHVLGIDELSQTIDRRPRVRAALPSVLGLRDLTPLIDADTRGRSSFDLDGARALAQVFSPTRAFDRTRAVLERHRFAVLTGPPEMGKTAIARMIALAQLTDGWEAHECNSPDQVWAAFDANRRQVFIADDAFGSTEYRADAAERWAHELARLLDVLDDRHWLIWTSRPAPLKAGLRRVQREHGSERFPAPAEILVDAGDLDLAEKTLILFRHAKQLRAGRDVRRLIRSTGHEIVEHPHFTPERIRRLFSGRRAELLEIAAHSRPISPGPNTGRLARSAGAAELLARVAGRSWRDLIERELTTPTTAMSNSFEALDVDHRDLLIAMLDVPAGFVDERDLAATLRRHHPGGLPARPRDLIDRLTDHFVRITPLGIGWVHPSWRDLVIDQLRRQPTDRQRFLRACGPYGAGLALSMSGGPTGDRALPLLLTDADWDVFADRVGRLVREHEDQDVTRLLLALAGALAADLPAAQRAEACSLAEYALTTARRTWFAADHTLSLPMIEAWYAVAAGLPHAVSPPVVATTWAALHPVSGSLARRDELARADDWLALARLLADRDPGQLAGLGFPAADQASLGALIAAAENALGSPDGQLGALAESILARIRSLAPADGLVTHRARAKLALDAAVRHDRWWTPADLDVPPTDEPAARPLDAFETADIARVLRDL